GGGRSLRRDLSLARAVRGGAGGARRAAHAQARQLARALPGSSHPARGLLRAGRSEADAGARGELRSGGGGGGAPARGGIVVARLMIFSVNNRLVRHPASSPRKRGPIFQRPVYLARRVPACAGTIAVCFGLSFTSFSGHAQAPQDFYKNKQIRMIIGHPVGNDYDLAGRFLARYLARHIPGEPTIVVQNMPAAASIAAANFLYAQAPRDGTVFGSFSRNVPSQALMGQMNVEAD